MNLIKSLSTTTLLRIMSVSKFLREFFSKIDAPVGGTAFFRKQNVNTKKA